MQVRADVDRVRRINRAVPFLDMLNLALLVHDKGGATSKLSFLIQDTVRLRDFTFHVTKKGKFDSDFLGECRVGRRGINADPEHSRVFEVDFARVDTRLVCLKLFRSTTGKGKNIECQNDILLASVIAQSYCRPLVAAQRKVGRNVSDLQKRVGELGLLLLCPNGRQSE